MIDGAFESDKERQQICELIRTIGEQIGWTQERRDTLAALENNQPVNFKTLIYLCSITVDGVSTFDALDPAQPNEIQ